MIELWDHSAPKRMKKLFCGDNLNVLRRYVADRSVDLIYLDPPFQSGKDYHLAFELRRSAPGDKTVKTAGFRDTWKWGPEAEASSWRTYA